MAKLTKRTADLATTGDKVTAIWDEELRGFGLRVYPNGRKVYVVKYRSRRVQAAPAGGIPGHSISLAAPSLTTPWPKVAMPRKRLAAIALRDTELYQPALVMTHGPICGDRWS